MALFESGIVQQTAPGTVSAMVWNPSGSSTTTYGALGSVPSTAVFHDVQITNSGTANLLLNSGSQSAANTTAGILLSPGQTLLITGYSGTVGTAGTIWANTGTVGYASAAVAGMPSVNSVV